MDDVIASDVSVRLFGMDRLTADTGSLIVTGHVTRPMQPLMEVKMGHQWRTVSSLRVDRMSDGARRWNGGDKIVTSRHNAMSAVSALPCWLISSDLNMYGFI